MNMLNSLILEGDVTDVGAYDAENSKVEFNICVERSYRYSNNVTITEKPVFKVVTYGKLASFASDIKRMYVGRGVRVVGRLTVEDDKVKVVAEHLEFKPAKRGSYGLKAQVLTQAEDAKAHTVEQKDDGTVEIQLGG